MSRIRSTLRSAGVAMAAVMGLAACTGDEPQSNSPSTATAESPAEQFDPRLAEPFCGMTTASLELPSREIVDYTEEQGAPDDDGSVITYTCLVLPSEEEQFAAAERGQAFAVVRTVLSIAHGDLASDPSLPSIPVPFSAGELDWEDLGEEPDAYVRTIRCPTEEDCGEAPAIEMNSYERTFKATHQNIYIEMTVTYEAPLDTAEDLSGSAEYALASYESYVTHLIQHLPQQ
ncbi:MAG TPA: hypothetical protein VFU12_11400 [Glycomyces sp.]|nr:hypothetical protein [Glycomyces sp.]